MGNEDEKFLNAYYKNIDLQTEEVLESSPLAIAVIDFIACSNEASETPTKLLRLLDTKAETLGINTKSNSWPKSASHLSRNLKELVTSLREIGIEVEWSKDPRQRHGLLLSGTCRLCRLCRPCRHQMGIKHEILSMKTTLETAVAAVAALCET
jgi:hypothetical protein